MALLLWKEYEVYFYDEDKETDYVGDFLERLAVEDIDKMHEIFRFFLERLGKGIGIPIEWTKGKNPKLKHLEGDLWEYRDRSNKTKRLIRMYFGVEKREKRIIFLGAHFKEDKKEQERELHTIRERWKKYKKKV